MCCAIEITVLQIRSSTKVSHCCWLFYFSLIRPLWEDLEQCKTSLSIVFGEKDLKFKAIAHKMFGKIVLKGTNGGVVTNKLHELVEVPNSGHAVHLENPLAVIHSIRLFVTRVRKNSQTDEGGC